MVSRGTMSYGGTLPATMAQSSATSSSEAEMASEQWEVELSSVVGEVAGKISTEPCGLLLA